MLQTTYDIGLSSPSRLHDLFLIKTDSNGISPSASTDSSNLELPEVIDIHKKIETTVCPNPFTNFTTIKIENSIFKNLDLVLFDARGRLVKKAINNSNDRFIIKREGLASGLYFFQVTTGKQVIGRGKLMVK